jgi:hypothetical protein
MAESSKPHCAAGGAPGTAPEPPVRAGRKLRVGLFVDLPRQPGWMVEAFAEVAALDFAEIAAIAEGGADLRRPPWLWRVYGRVDGWLFGLPAERIELKTRIPRPRLPSLPDIGAGLPGDAELLRSLLRLGRRSARRGLQKLAYVDQWCIAYRVGGSERWQGDLSSLTPLLPPKDCYWADPFPLARGGRHYIFFEELEFANGRGYISAVELNGRGACSAQVRVLQRGYHLSYPFPLEHQGEFFMIPETGENRPAELFRCIDFPDRRRLEKVLLRGVWFVDATVHRAGDWWWLFVNMGAEPAAADDELHLYRADSLRGERVPHRVKPVKSDVRADRLRSVCCFTGRAYRSTGWSTCRRKRIASARSAFPPLRADSCWGYTP